MSRGPFVLNVADLLGRDASPRPERVVATVDWGIELSRVSGDTPIEADLMLHPVSKGIAVTGSVAFRTQDACFRCLDVTETDRTAMIGALFDTTEDDESYPLDGADIDVEQMLRDEILLSLPMSPECPDGCERVVSSAQKDLNTDTSDDEEGARSPFAVLKDLLDED